MTDSDLKGESTWPCLPSCVGGNPHYCWAAKDSKLSAPPSIRNDKNS